MNTKTITLSCSEKTLRNAEQIALNEPQCLLCVSQCNRNTHLSPGKIKGGLLLILLSILFSGCKTRTVYVPVESVRTEYRDRLRRDSVHLYDSIFVKEKGDSVILEKYKYIYRDRLRTDTILLTDSIAVPYAVTETREVKVYPRWLIVLACLGSLSAGIGGYGIYRKIASFFKK